MSAVAAGALFFGVLLLVVAGMVLQETRSRPATELVYVLEEVVPFVHRRLPDDLLARLDREDVQRILEWEIHYLQGIDRRNGDAPVAGSDEAVAYVLERTAAKGHHYQRADVAEVLAKEADYLAEIGALGPPVGGGDR